MRTIFSVMTACFAISACQIQVPPPAPDVLRQMSNNQLCQGYSTARATGSGAAQSSYFEELRRRGALTTQQRDDIGRQIIRTGTPEHVAICAWGPYQRVNTTAGTFGRHNQIVMGDFGPYVYTVNGRVQSWQTSLR